MRTPKTPAPSKAKAKPAKAATADKPAQAAPPAEAGAGTGAAKAVRAGKADTAKPGETLRIKDLVARVAAATGAKKPEAKQAVEATLAAIGAALDANATLVVPPLGKLRVAKAQGGTMTLKLRSAKDGAKSGEKSGAKPLAKDDEDE